MAKTITQIRSLARSHTRSAINVLVGVMRSTSATPAARVSAANAILDRGWGKAPQAIENGELVLPTKPGLGLKFDEKAIARFKA